MENSVELAKYMQKYVCEATGRQNMGAQQDNLAVLRLSSMPGCLVECGFISTGDEESFMNSKAADGMYARGLFNAFLAYRKHHGGNMTISYQPVTEAKEEAKPQPQPEPKQDTKKKGKQKAQPEAKPEPQLEVKPVPEMKPEPQLEVKPQPEVKSEPALEVKPEPEVKPELEVKQEVKTEPEVLPEAITEAPPAIQPLVSQPQGPVFKVQIFASSALIKAGDARFKGLTGVGHYQDGGMYKYTVGDSADYNEVSRLRREISDKFPQAFVIAFKDGVRMDINQAIREFKSKR